MFADMISKTVKSGETKENIITDGTYMCTYQELPGIFQAFDTFFAQPGISSQDCSMLRCRNAVPDVVLLLWMLYRERETVLLPPLNPKQQQEPDDSSLPEFCKNKLLVSPGLRSPNLDMKDPGSYVAIETNANYRKDADMLRDQGNTFLKTSGSTAEPKLVMHSNIGLAGNALNCADRLGLNHNDRIIIPVPIYHMYGLGAGFLPGIIKGASINLVPNTNVIKYLEQEKQFNPNISFMTPTLCSMLLKTRKSPYPYRLVVTASDRISKTTFENFEKKFGKLVNLYGSTELGAIATSKLDDSLETRTHGIIETLPGVEIDFAEVDEENDKNQDQVSEILCRHAYGFDTYVDKTGKRITGETNRWFRTKDLGKRMGNNRFKVVGRTGNSVNRNGILVAFSEVESLMEQGIEEIAHAVVVAGDEEGVRGKKMKAWCELKPNKKINKKNIRSQCFHIMLRHMVPDEVQVLEEIPRLPNGKFDRKALSE